MKGRAALAAALLALCGAASARAAPSRCEALAEVEPARGFVGQQLHYRLRILRRRDVGSLEWATPLSFPTFRSEWLPGVTGDARVEREGETWLVFVERRALFPAHAGRLRIPAAALRCASPDGEEIAPIPALEVLVDELPAEGRPEGFGGLLGPIELTAALTPSRVTLGETLRVSVLLRGDTNLWDARSPRAALETAEVDVFERPAELARDAGRALFLRRYFYFDVVPRRAGVLQLPELRIPYFDPGARRYAEARARLAPIEVREGGGGAGGQAGARLRAAASGPSRATARRVARARARGGGRARRCAGLRLAPPAPAGALLRGGGDRTLARRCARRRGAPGCGGRRRGGRPRAACCAARRIRALDGGDPPAAPRGGPAAGRGATPRGDRARSLRGRRSGARRRRDRGQHRAAALLTSRAMSFSYQPIFELTPSETPWRKLAGDFVSTASFEGQRILKVDSEALVRLAAAAVRDVSHLFRPGHLAQLHKILDDPEASDNDRFVALEMLKNANVSAGMVLPSCQDTGTAIVVGHKGQRVFTSGDDAEALSRGIYETYTGTSLRYSQMAPLTMFDEMNTGTNLPAQIEIYAEPGDEYELMFVTKGGGSANKTFLFQETRALLNPDSLLKFLDAKIRTLGTAACPPYHLAIVIGGPSAEFTLKTVKLASCRSLDGLPTTGNAAGRAFRDLALEEKVHALTQRMGIGAQFGGKYFCHDVRVVRLPRHGASCPVGLGVSCSADRQILGRISHEGVFLEQLETNPAKYLPEVEASQLPGEVVEIDLRRPMSEIRAALSRHPVKTRLSLSGPLIVARDIAHAKLKERIDRGEGLPQYMKDHMVYYAGPAKTPDGYASGSFGPTTAGRMDSYVDLFMQHGGSFVTLAKGNRSKAVTEACQKHGGFYLGSIGGPAAILARDCIKKVEVLEYPELGMEAVWRIEVERFPAFVVVDDKGNDFFAAI